MKETGRQMGDTLPEQSIRFCVTPDGVRLAYATAGEGQPLVRTADWLGHVEFEWRSPMSGHWWRALTRSHQLIRFDQRGCGLSDRDVKEAGLEEWVTDLATVVDAAGLERFTLFAANYNGPPAIAYAARSPDRVARLVLYGTYALGWRHRGLSQGAIDEWNALLTVTRSGFGRDEATFRRMYGDLLAPDATEEQLKWFSHMARFAASADTAADIMTHAGDSNVQHLLTEIKCPTLVVHAARDHRVPFEWRRWLAAGIPQARFVTLDSRNHILLESEPAWGHFQRELRAFLEEEAAA